MKKVRVLAASLFLICLLFYAYAYLQVVQIPTALKLADCKSKVVTTSFVCPKGDLLSLEIGTKPNNTLTCTGQASIFQSGKNIANYSFDNASTKNTNALWLHKLRTISISPIRSSGEKRSLDSLLTTDDTYDVVIKFDKMPPCASSLWIHYLRQPFRF